jgi:cytochrome c oxidase subunit III
MLAPGPMEKRQTSRERVFEAAKKLHPLKVMVICIIAGITVLFLCMMCLFALYNPGLQLDGQKFPRPFIVSTLLIVASSFTMERAWREYKRDDGSKQLNALMITLALAIGFTITQYLGWMQLWKTGITLFGIGHAPGETRTPGGAFLFIISGLHLLHLAGGLVFLFLSMFKIANVRGDDVRSVIYFSDALERTRMEMLVKYWHFLGGLWLLLFLYFLWFFV